MLELVLLSLTSSKGVDDGIEEQRIVELFKRSVGCRKDLSNHDLASPERCAHRMPSRTIYPKVIKTMLHILPNTP